MLKAWWDWKDERTSMLSAEAWTFVKGEYGINKARFGKSYEAPYQVDYSKFDSSLTAALAQYANNGRPLGAGAQALLRQVWARENTNLTFEQWLKVIVAAYKL